MTSMMNPQLVREATVYAHIAAENAGDVEATLATFHRPRYVLPTGEVNGEEAVRQLVSGLIAAFPDFHFEIGSLRHNNDAVIVEGVMTGTHKADWAGLTATGRRMEVPLTCVFEFDRYDLVSEGVIFDFATLQRQLEL